ncbi:hypothetical protein GS399_08205 [Pedobacter sp. HMF7647]|uniref:Response regulatory domain-containing protein n=1 Tax=Hufsiella arboris TaxID=2695275 RepID=A0A7K1Y8N2_9SPHI|nr:hypothetical protein [Hufsiella arboris]MXV50952.1 hypothetical protein [Hufsiella arboris]
MLNNIMFIDNSPLNNQLTETLNKKNQLFETANFFINPIEALEFLVQNHNHINELPEAIVADANFQEIGFIEFSRTLNSIIPILAKKPILYIKNFALSQNERDVLNEFEFVKGYFNKTISLNELMEISQKDNRFSSAV